MRKILAILAAVGLTATTGTTLVSCGTKHEDKDYTKVEGVNAWNNNIKQVQGYVIDQIGTTFESAKDMNEKIKTIDFSKVARNNIIFADNLSLGKSSGEKAEAVAEKAPKPTGLSDYSVYIVAVRSSTKGSGSDKKNTLKIDYLVSKSEQWTYANFGTNTGFNYDNVFVTYTN
ncbi:lipoprotein [Mesoplasma coleopterae]|uniref:Lipoprotein n=1 Tax=Mesoplasma coleopterae TaxID=324078 RepID=A0A2K8P4M0_9MOLU|nr:lipoprotein [Mesoplasma coleopterae]ATZ20545.1 hypothetical protein MCOLE_v1c00300 [Mesoplasma coleopterae]